MIWALDLDDANGHCGGRKFPLLSLINEKLLNIRIPSVQLPKKLPDKPYKELKAEADKGNNQVYQQENGNQYGSFSQNPEYQKPADYGGSQSYLQGYIDNHQPESYNQPYGYGGKNAGNQYNYREPR